MTRHDALELLGLSPSATASDIAAAYESHYNDLRLRLDHAPTPALQRKFRDALARLEEVYVLVGSSAPADAYADLPASAPVGSGRSHTAEALPEADASVVTTNAATTSPPVGTAQPNPVPAARDNTALRAFLGGVAVAAAVAGGWWWVHAREAAPAAAVLANARDSLPVAGATPDSAPVMMKADTAPIVAAQVAPSVSGSPTPAKPARTPVRAAPKDLWEAAAVADVPAMERFLARGDYLEVKRSGQIEHIDGSSSSGCDNCTPLRVATMAGSQAATLWLIKKGANWREADHWVVKYSLQRWPSVVSLLLEQGLDPNAYLSSYPAPRPLLHFTANNMYAPIDSGRAIRRLLISRGADPSARQRDANGYQYYSFLDECLSTAGSDWTPNARKLARACLEDVGYGKGGPRFRDGLLEGRFALHKVVCNLRGAIDEPQAWWTDVAQLIRAEGVSLEGPYMNGMSVLTYAAADVAGPGLIACLLAEGLDPNRPDARGMTPLQAARTNTYSGDSVAVLLRKAGARE